MSKIPVFEIKVPSYEIKEFSSFSGEKHYTEFGTPVPIEYWKCRPDFFSISLPIINLLRKHHKGKKIGLRMLGSINHENKTVDELIEIIRQLGYDRYDPNRKDNNYENFDGKKIDLFMLEIQVGKEKGIDGEEQIMHALHSFYVYPEKPVRVDIGIVYDLESFEHTNVVFAGKEEICHTFKDQNNRREAVLEILKIIPEK